MSTKPELNQDGTSRYGLLIACLGFVASALVRLLPHDWNAVPLGASAMMAAAACGPLWAVILLVGTLAVTDVGLWLVRYRALGFDAFTVGTLFVYTAYAGYIIAGRFTVRRSRWWLVPVAAVGGSVFFFVVSNFGVWVTGGYERTLEGLIQCYVAAIPFFRGTLLADILYAAIFFAAWGAIVSLASEAKAEKGAQQDVG